VGRAISLSIESSIISILAVDLNVSEVYLKNRKHKRIKRITEIKKYGHREKYLLNSSTINFF
jgi:hypothetical protein